MDAFPQWTNEGLASPIENESQSLKTEQGIVPNMEYVYNTATSFQQYPHSPMNAGVQTHPVKHPEIVDIVEMVNTPKTKTKTKNVRPSPKNSSNIEARLDNDQKSTSHSNYKDVEKQHSGEGTGAPPGIRTAKIPSPFITAELLAEITTERLRSKKSGNLDILSNDWNDSSTQRKNLGAFHTYPSEKSEHMGRNDHGAHKNLANAQVMETESSTKSKKTLLIILSSVLITLIIIVIIIFMMNRNKRKRKIKILA